LAGVAESIEQFASRLMAVVAFHTGGGVVHRFAPRRLASSTVVTIFALTVSGSSLQASMTSRRRRSSKGLPVRSAALFAARTMHLLLAFRRKCHRPKWIAAVRRCLMHGLKIRVSPVQL
jgi:hypothetical protein